MKRIAVSANTDELDNVLDFVNTELDFHGFPSEAMADIDLAVEEVFVNISSYAYESQNGEVVLYISVSENEATLRFEDSGKPFNPLEVPAPDLDKPLMERDIGGLGILFVKQVMDEVLYSYSGGKNILTMKKGGCDN